MLFDDEGMGGWGGGGIGSEVREGGGIGSGERTGGGGRRWERETRRERSEMRQNDLIKILTKKILTKKRQNSKDFPFPTPHNPHNPHNRNLPPPNAMKLISHLLRLSGSLYFDASVFS